MIGGRAWVAPVGTPFPGPNEEPGPEWRDLGPVTGFTLDTDVDASVVFNPNPFLRRPPEYTLSVDGRVIGTLVEGVHDREGRRLLAQIREEASTRASSAPTHSAPAVFDIPAAIADVQRARELLLQQIRSDCIDHGSDDLGDADGWLYGPDTRDGHVESSFFDADEIRDENAHREPWCVQCGVHRTVPDRQGRPRPLCPVCLDDGSTTYAYVRAVERHFDLVFLLRGQCGCGACQPHTDDLDTALKAAGREAGRLQQQMIREGRR